MNNSLQTCSPRPQKIATNPRWLWTDGSAEVDPYISDAALAIVVDTFMTSEDRRQWIEQDKINYEPFQVYCVRKMAGQQDIARAEYLAVILVLRTVAHFH